MIGEDRHWVIFLGGRDGSISLTQKRFPQWLTALGALRKDAYEPNKLILFQCITPPDEDSILANPQNTTALVNLRQKMAQATGTCAEDWFPVYKARYGMHAVFSALASLASNVTGQRQPGVLTQLYTCCTAVDPILAAGLRGVYVDVNPDSLTAQVQTGGKTVQNPLAGLVMQNTFGFISDADTLAARDFATARKLLYVEDSAHCVGRIARDSQGEPLADVSVHSFGVEKILTATRFGGLIWVNPRLKTTDSPLYAAIVSALENVGRLPWLQDVSAQLYLNQIRVFSRLPRMLANALKRVLRRMRLFEPAIAPAERRGALEYPNYGMSPYIANKACEALDGLESNQEQRRQAVAIYQDRLSGRDYLQIPAQIACAAPQPLLIFPILLRDTRAVNEVHAKLRESHVYSRRWYNSILFPGVDSLEPYGVGPLESYPHTVSLAQRSLGLPTDVSKDKAEQICELVQKLAAA